MSSECPSPAALEAAAADPSAESPLLAHLAGCSACRSAMQEIRANNRFLPGARLAYVAMKEEPAASSEEPAPPVPRDLFPGYEIQDEIHRGGQGIVYRAVQLQTRRAVAIKMLLGGTLASSRQRERFEREVRIAASLRHPHIVTIYDSGAIPDGRFGLVMEFIDGRPLNEWSGSLDRSRGRDARRQALRTRLGLMVKVCDAVLCAHQHSIVHRDLKPANILVDSAGEPHILDFGIARDTGPQGHTRLTNTGEFAGTLAYASPEQVSGDLSKVDTRTDIYSLGVIMYEMVSGGMPYAVDGAFGTIIRNIESTEPVPLPRRARHPDGPWVDGDVSTIILKSLAKDPARRYQTVANLRSDIERYLSGEAIEARRDSTWYVIRKTARRHRLAFGALAAVFVILAAFGAWAAWQAERLAGALSTSNIERGRVTAMSGDLGGAQDLIWAEFLRSGGSRDGFSGSATGIHAYWALWDTYRQVPCIATFHVGESGCELPFFADGGRSLCVVTRDGTLYRWSVPEWRPEGTVRIATAEKGSRFHSTASRDGLRVALLGCGAVRIADARTGSVLAETPDPDDASITGAFSPGGDRLATIGRDGRLRLRDTSSLDIVWESPDQSVCEFSQDQFCDPAYTPDGSRIAAARPDGSLGFWDAATGALGRVLSQPDSAAPMAAIGMRASRIAFSADGGQVAASMGTHVIVWEGEAAPVDLIGHIANVSHVEFVPGRPDRLYSVGREGALLWDLRAAEPDHTYTAPAPDGRAQAISPDGRWIVLGASTVRVLEATPEPYVSVLNKGEGPGGAVTVSHSGRTVALARGRGGPQGQSVLLMDLESRSVEREFRHPDTRVMDVAFAPDDLSLYVSESVGRIVQWDLATGTQVHVYTLPDVQPRPGVLVGENEMRLSPDGRTLACADALGLVGLWDTSRGAWIGAIVERSGSPSSVDFSPDGATLLIARRAGSELWDLQRRAVIRKFPEETPRPLLARFSPDGRTYVQTRQGQNTDMRDAQTGRVLTGGPLLGSAGLTPVFHPSGRIVIGAAQDQSVRLWDARTSRVLLSLRKHEAPVISLALTPDGRRLISSDLEGTVLVWDLAHYQEHIRREWESRTSGESR